MAESLREMSRYADRSIRRRMGLVPPDFREIHSEPVLGDIWDTRDPFSTNYLDRFGPIRRLLSKEDEIWLSKEAPQLSPSIMVMRRRLMTAYADTIEDDLDLLWTGKRLIAQVDTSWRWVEMLVWKAEAMFLVTQLRSAITLYRLGNLYPHDFAKRVVNDLEAFIANAVRESRRPLPI